LLQALIDYYQKNTLEKIFPEVKTHLQIPFKQACEGQFMPLFTVIALRLFFLIMSIIINHLGSLLSVMGKSQVKSQSQITSYLSKRFKSLYQITNQIT